MKKKSLVKNSPLYIEQLHKELARGKIIVPNESLETNNSKFKRQV